MNHKVLLFSSLRWMAGAKIAGQVLNWLITIVVIRLLTPDDYGLIALATTFVAFLSTVSELGLGTALVQAKEIDDRRIAQVFGATALLNSGIFVVLLAAAPLVADFFSDERLTAIIRVSGLAFLLSIPLVVSDALLRRAMSFKSIALIEGGCGLAGNILTLACASAGLAVWSLVIGTLFATATRMIATIVIAPRWIWPVFSFRNTSGLMTFGGTITLSRVLWYFMSQADILVAGRTLGREALGHYSLAMTLASLPMERVMAVINPVAFPAIARIQHDGSAVSRAMSTSTALLGLIAFPTFWGISSVADELVLVVLGPKWLDAAIALQVVTLVMPIRMIASLLSVAASAMGRPDIELKVTTLGAIVMPISFFAGSQFGLTGLSFGWLVGVPIVFGASLGSRLAVLGMNSKGLIAAIGPSLFASAAMYCAVLGVKYLAKGLLSPIALLFTMIAVGAFAYIGLAWAFNRKAMTQAAEALRPRASD